MNKQFIASMLFAFSAYQFAPAHADETRSVRISYADLNLSSPAGQKALDARVRRAISEVCDSGLQDPLAWSSDVRRCREKARAGAHTQVAVAMAKASRLAANATQTAQLDTRR